MKILKAIVLTDLIVTGAVALLQVAFAGLLNSFLNISEAWLFYSGVFLVIYCAELGVLLRNEQLFQKFSHWIVYINIGWALACAGFLILNPVTPNALGIAFVAVQIFSVIAFAIAQTAVTKFAVA